jgi:type II secretion system protein G
MKKSKKGFTLIELLVVIAIIGLLATLSVVALNSARVKARDARRVSDIKQIQTALEMYFNEKNAYPGTGINTTLSDVNGFSATASGTVYLGKVPSNPTPRADGATACPDTDYVYTQAGSGGSSYTLSYCLGSGANAGKATATPSGIR